MQSPEVQMRRTSMLNAEYVSPKTKLGHMESFRRKSLDTEKLPGAASPSFLQFKEAKKIYYNQKETQNIF